MYDGCVAFYKRAQNGSRARSRKLLTHLYVGLLTVLTMRMMNWRQEHKGAKNGKGRGLGWHFRQTKLCFVFYDDRNNLQYLEHKSCTNISDHVSLPSISWKSLKWQYFETKASFKFRKVTTTLVSERLKQILQTKLNQAQEDLHTPIKYTKIAIGYPIKICIPCCRRDMQKQCGLQ